MYWAQLTRSSAQGVTPSSVRYQIIARQQTATIAPPAASRYGLVRSQPGMVGRG